MNGKKSIDPAKCQESSCIRGMCPNQPLLTSPSSVVQRPSPQGGTTTRMQIASLVHTSGCSKGHGLQSLVVNSMV